ncbi:MAG: peptidase MA family metallohydrolase [Bradymonadia bacterium]
MNANRSTGALGKALPAVLTAMLMVLSLNTSAHAVSMDTLKELHNLVTDWQVAEARRRLEPLKAESPEDWDLGFVEARLLFFEGRYGESKVLLESLGDSLSGSTDPEAIGRVASMMDFRKLVTETHEALKDFDEFTTEDGRFTVRYKGRDEIMVPWLVDVLRKADAAFTADFDFKPEGRVLVELYPQINYLAKVSPLTEEDIETSGTIALCKYNRLMFTSPRALVRGYGWRDTVSHEFVHYYITHVSRNSVPIWLHEGIAKFEEARWRADPGLPLDPPQEDLLARSLKADKLVTFQQMHPSMAKLPSQEAASLAYAEVHTVINYLYGKSGYGGLNTLLAALKSGQDMNGALTTAYGVDLDGLWKVWKKYMKRQGLKTYPGLVQTSLKFKRPGEEAKPGEEPEIDFSTISEKKIKDFTHLGELLRARGRHTGAIKEYEKAIALGGDGNPVIQNSVAKSLIAVGRHNEVPAALERVRSYYPTFLTTFMNLGEAHLHQDQVSEALEAFENALGINPFHPRVHEALTGLYEKAGRAEEAARSRKALETLK